MNLACKTLASFLLIFICSSKGTDHKATEVKGILHDDINLDIPVAPEKIEVNDIQWYRGKDKIARFKEDKLIYQPNKTYQLFKNGTLKIEHLQRNDRSSYKVELYHKNGSQIYTMTFNLKILERVAKPEISWNCINTTLTCKVTKGTEPKLKLYQKKKLIKQDLSVIIHNLATKNKTQFSCTATNEVSEETSTVDVKCSEEGLDVYLISGICVGGVLFPFFMALLILFIIRKRRAPGRRNGEELDITAHRTTSEEKSQRPNQIPASAPQHPALSQAPLPPSHRPKAHGHRPPPPGHRGQHPPQHQPQKRPLPAPGTQMHQQKGPPLPRPRVQPKPPRGARENS